MTTDTYESIPQSPDSPETAKHTSEAKRDALRAKIEASERRIAERSFSDQAKEAAGNAKEYTKKHPLIVIGGALVFGLLIGAATRPGRRLARSAAAGTAGLVGAAAEETRHAGAKTKRAGKKTKRKASRLGDLASDVLVGYGIKMIDGAAEGARYGQDAFEDLGDSAAAKARKLRREAQYIAGSTADNARTASRRASRRAGRSVRGIAGR